MPQYIENFLDETVLLSYTYDNILNKLKEDYNWAIMKINEQEVKSGKIGSFYGLKDEHGSLPYFRCPSFEECFEATEWMTELIHQVNSKLNAKTNLIKIQQYINGKSGIGRHSDKTLDMDPNENIIILRINKDTNKTRCIIFKDKNTGDEEKFVMKSNSVLVISADENKKMVHYVPEHENENETSEECLSFVFRTIGTFINPETKIKYGIGAKYETWEERIKHLSTEKPIEMKEINHHIVSMYHYENTTDLSKEKNNEYFDTVKNLTV